MPGMNSVMCGLTRVLGKGTVLFGQRLGEEYGDDKMAACGALPPGWRGVRWMVRGGVEPCVETRVRVAAVRGGTTCSGVETS